MISLYDLLESSGGQLLGEPAAQLFDDFCFDARHIKENQLFVAVKSEQGDTHRHIARAIHNGAAGILCNRPPEFDTSGVSVLLVRDTVDALLAWSVYIVQKYDVAVIAVCGVASKAITAAAIARVLGNHQTIYAEPVEGDVRLSIPMALTALTAQHRFVVLRLDRTEPDDITPMIKRLRPAGIVFTGGHDQSLQGTQSETPFARQVLDLVAALPSTGIVAVNGDDLTAEHIVKHTQASVICAGLGCDICQVKCENVRYGLEGTLFDLNVDGKRYPKHWIPLLGRHGLYSVMLAISVGRHYGVSIEQALKSLESLNPLPGRMNALRGRDGIHLIDDTFGATPYTTLSALDWLESVRFAQGRIFVILGDTTSSGAANGNMGHQTVAAKTASVVDVLVTRGAEAAVFAQSVLDCGMDRQHVHITHAVPDAINALVQTYTLTSNDIVLVQGGATARMEKVVQALLYDPADRWQLIRQDVSWVTAVTGEPWRLNWIEIDSDALANNVRAIKSIIGPDKSLLAVVKADAYGHGALVAARTALRNGAEYLGVSSLLEAADLRSAGIEAPMLVMNYTPEHLIQEAIQQGITVTLYDLQLARAYNRIASRLGRRLRVHVKIDTGMGRLGVLPEDTVDFLRHVLTLSYIEVEGLFTHFSCADVDRDHTSKQVDVFRQVVRQVQAITGAYFKYIHAANSAGTIAHPEALFNMVRVGAAIYGMHPSDQVKLPPQFRAVMSWKTIVAQVKSLPPGHPVGYGNTYITSQEERIAILPVGFADGFRRGPYGWREVLINGQRAPVIGRVSMEKAAIDVSHIPQVTIGDEVVLLGRQHNDAITLEEIAAWMGTSNYELVCSILPRASRR